MEGAQSVLLLPLLLLLLAQQPTSCGCQSSSEIFSLLHQHADALSHSLLNKSTGQRQLIAHSFNGVSLTQVDCNAH
jgi:hypothetical protein